MAYYPPASILVIRYSGPSQFDTHAEPSLCSASQLQNEEDHGCSAATPSRRRSPGDRSHSLLAMKMGAVPLFFTVTVTAVAALAGLLRKSVQLGTVPAPPGPAVPALPPDPAVSVELLQAVDSADASQRKWPRESLSLGVQRVRNVQPRIGNLNALFGL